MGWELRKIKKNKVPCHTVADKLLVGWLPRELCQLETETLGDLEAVLYVRRILLLECYRTCVIRMTKSCILEILNL